MDLFAFDLQLFADVEIDLAGAGVDGKNLYASINGAAATWMTSTEYQEVITSGGTVLVLAGLQQKNVKISEYVSVDKTLSIIADNGQSIQIKAASAGNAALKGYHVQLVQNVNESGVPVDELPKFNTCSIEYIDNENVGIASADFSPLYDGTSVYMYFDSQNVGRVEVGEGVTYNGISKVPPRDEPATFEIDPETGDVTLFSGYVSTKDRTVRINGLSDVTFTPYERTYDGADPEFNGTVSVGLGSAYLNGDPEQVVPVYRVFNTTIVNESGKDFTFENDTTQITIPASWDTPFHVFHDHGRYLSGFAPGFSFTWKKESTDGDNCTCTVADDGKTMVITGDKVSVYTLNPSALDTLEFGHYGYAYFNDLEPLQLNLKLEYASAETGTTFYALDKTGKVWLCVDGSGNPLNAAPTISGDVIGYFKVVTAWNDGAPEVKVTFAGKALAEGATESDVPSYFGKVKVNATAVAKISNGGTSRSLTRLAVTGISRGKSYIDDSQISVVGLASTAITDYVGSVSSLLDWNGVNYFKVDFDSDNASTIGEVSDPWLDPYGIFLEVTSTKADGVATIKSTRFVQTARDTYGNFKWDANGNYVLSEIKSSLGLKWLYLDADGLNGVTFASGKHPSQKVIIRNAAKGGVFTGLNNTDAIEFTNENGTFTVNNKACSFQDGKITVDGKELIPAGGDEAPVVCVDGTVVKGTFTLDKNHTSLTASAVPKDKEDTVSRDITYTGSGSGSGEGVKVVVKMNGYNTGGEITGVMDMHDGEKVVVKNYRGKVGTKNETTTIEKKGGVITKTYDSVYLPMPITLTSTTTDPTVDLLSWRSFEMETRFDFGATTAGSIGLFEADKYGNLTIAAQPEGQKIGPCGEKKNYVRVLAQQSGSTYTISDLEIMVFNDKNNPDEYWREWERDQLTHYFNQDHSVSVTIAAPTDGNLTLKNGAIELDTDRQARDEYGYPKYDDINGKPVYVKDYRPSLFVTNAQGGKSYTGFTADDSITGEIAAGQTIKVGSYTYTAGADCTVSIRGDGKGVSRGTLYIPKDGLHFANSSITGSANAIVQLGPTSPEESMTAVKKIMGLKAGQKVTVSTKLGPEYNYKIYKTEVYEAKAVTNSTALEITYTRKEYNQTKEIKKYKVPGSSANIMTDVTVKSSFDWTKPEDSYFLSDGYFLVSGLTADKTEFGEVEVKPTATTISPADAGSYYLKVALSADGAVSGLTLEKVGTDGQLTTDATKLAAITAGTLNITAPAATGLHLDRTAAGLPDTVAVHITGAVKDSVIANLRESDSLKTATLAVGDAVTVNGDKYTAAAAGFLKFEGGTKLAEGTLSFTKDTEAKVITTTAGTYAVSVTAEKETAIVKVLDGAVTAISGLENGSVTVADGLGNEAVYDKNGISFTQEKLKTGTLATASLKAGQTVTIDGTTYTTGANGAMKFDVDAAEADGAKAKVIEGTLELTKDGSFTSTGEGAVTYNAEDDSETAKNNVLITVRNGKVVSVTGLKKGDTLTVAAVKVPNADGSGFETKQVVYKAVSDTVVTKTVGDGAPITTYLSAAGGDVVGARYIVEGADVSAGANALTGQFSWTYASSRSTSFFALSSRKTAAIGEQAASVSVAAAKGKKATYVMANTALDALFVPKTAQYRYVLTLGAIQVSNDGGVTKVSSADAGLLDGATVTINAPTVAIPSTTKVKSGGEDTKVVTPALSYTKNKDDNYHIVLNKVAKRSSINGLAAGDAVTTATLEAGQIVTLDGVRYTAATKGALKFIGEGKNSDGTNKAALQSGTIRLYKEGENTYYTANISGATNSMDDDVKVTASGLAEGEYVTVKVENGVVKSITGLRTEGATVTITQKGAEVIYGVVSSYPSWNKPGLYDTIIARKEGDKEPTFASFKDNQDIYAATSYKETSKNTAKTNKTNTAELWTTNGRKTAFVAWEYPAPTLAQKADVVADAAERGRWYLAATVNMAMGVTTIEKLEMAQINAVGELKPVSGKIPDERVIIDGTIDEEKKEYAKLSYNGSKINKTPVTVINAGLGSDFKNIKETDKITSADTGEAGYTLSKGKVTIYKYSGGKQTMQTITHANGDKVNIVAAGGQVTKITGLDKAGESVTIVEGGTTTIYTMGSDSVMTKTVITQDGAKKVYTSTGGTVLDGVVGASFVAAPAIGEIVSDFDWTTAKNRTGYFAVSDGNATAKAQKSPVKIKNGDGNKYIAVTISADGIVQGISQKVFDESAEGGMANTTDKFAGTLTIAAPTKNEMSFSRLALDGNTISSDAKVAVTGVISGSAITDLKAGDTVTTAKLAKPNLKGVGGSVLLEGNVYRAGADGELGFEVKDVAGGLHYTLVKGKVMISPAFGDADGVNKIYVGTKLITATNGKIVVTASSSGADYTIENLKEGESFAVKDFEKKTLRTYQKSSSVLFCKTETYNNDWSEVQSTTTSFNPKSTGASVTGKILEGLDGWTIYDEANTTFKADHKLVSDKEITVNLANLDKRIAADKAAPGSSNYEFVIDKYMAKPKDFKGAASVIAKMNEAAAIDVQEVIGTVTGEYVYTATSTISQNVTATNGWKVVGSGLDDVITGASKGSDTMNGGAGSDTLTGGGANDTFEFDAANGNDVVKSYITGKDKLTVAYEDFDLDNIVLIATKVGNKSTADVLLHDGTYTGKDEEGNILATNSVLVSGVGNGKAVTINNKTYFFGSAVETKGKTASMTFAYAEGAYYLGSGNTAKGNTLSVGTDKNKAAAKVLGDAVEVDLSDTTHYRNIGTVDASKSGNALVLTASGVGSTLKGGTYQSILKAGSGQDSLVGGAKGNDLFWFDTVEKDDAVSGYASGKDSVYLGDIAKDGDGKIVAAHTNATKINGMTIAASKSGDVVISNGDTGSVTLQKAASATKAITVRADADGKDDALSYYIGKAGAYNSKTGALTKRGANTFTATIGKEAELDKTEAKNLSLKTNYYVGNDDADDTLKIVGVDTPDPADKTKKKKLAVTAKVSLKDLATNLSSIDILDASGLTKAAGSKITLEGKTTGDSTLKGSTLAAIAETFIVSSTGKTTVQNLTAVSDVIELAAGLSLLDAGGQNGKNVVYTLSNGGKLQIDGVQLADLVADTSGGVTKITRSK